MELGPEKCIQDLHIIAFEFAVPRTALKTWMGCDILKKTKMN